MARLRFGLTLEAKRLARSWTQEQLAERLGTSPVTVSRWESDLNIPDPKMFEKIRETLNISIEDMEIYIEEFLINSSEAKAGSRPLVGAAGYVRDVFKGEWVEFLKYIIELDRKMISGIHDDHEGYPDQWADIFKTNQDCWRIIIQDRKVIGYWHFVPLTDAAFAAMKAGNMKDSELTVDHVDQMILPKGYKVYITMVGILDTYRNTKTNKLLMESFSDAFLALAQLGYFIDEICACAHTTEGARLCSLMMNMKEVAELKDGKDRGVFPIYYADQRSFLESNMFKRNSKLLRLYSSK